MEPNDFFELQRNLLGHAEQQTKLLEKIHDRIAMLGWVIAIVVTLILVMSLK